MPVGSAMQAHREAPWVAIRKTWGHLFTSPPRSGLAACRSVQDRIAQGRALHLLREFEESWLKAWSNARPGGSASGRIAARWGDDRRSARDRNE